MAAEPCPYRTLVVWSLCLAAALTPLRALGESHATPEERKAAQQLVEQGAKLHQSGDDAGALDKFQQAYRLFPTPKLHFNIALMLADLGNNADAADALQQFLDAAAADPKLNESEFPATARKRLAQLEPTIGRVDLSVTPVEASVTVDSRAGHRGIVYLSPGTHQLIASAAGFEASIQLVAIAAGQRQVLAVALHPLVATPVPTADLRPAPVPSPAPATITVVSSPAASPSVALAPKIAWFMGGALGIGAAVMSGMAFSQYQSLAPQSGPAPAHLSGAYADELRNARIADGLWAGAIVAGAVGTGLWLFAAPAGSGGEIHVGGKF